MLFAGNPEPEEEDNAYLEDPSLKCRFYRNRFPGADDLVMGNIKSTDAQAEVTEVTLLEYDNKQGMLLHSEVSRRRIRSIKRFIKVNHNAVLAVLRVDEERGYIDLSKRQVTEGDVIECQDRYNKAKVVHSILRKVARERGMVLENLYERVGWPFYDLYGHAYNAFKICIGNLSSIGEEVDPFNELDEPVEDDLKECIIRHIRRRLAPRASRVRTTIDISCPSFEGINAIKEAITYGITCDAEIEVELIASPSWSLQISSSDIEKSLNDLREATERIRERILEKGGKLLVRRPPWIVSTRDEEEHQQMLERIQLDEYEEEDDEGDGDVDGDVDGDGEV